MSQIKDRRRRRRARKFRNICIIAVIVIILIVFLAVLLKTIGSKKDADKQGENLTQEIVKLVEFPYELEDGTLEVSSLFQYTGMNPDCNDEAGEDIASLVITNKSEKHLANAQFTVVLENGTEMIFKVTDVPAGQTVWAYETANSSYDLSVNCKSITCEAVFEESTSLMKDKLSIDIQETKVTLTNTSENELTDLSVYCHCFFEEAYFGGLTYIYPVDTIPAGESITFQAEECYLGQAEVVRVSQGS